MLFQPPSLFFGDQYPRAAGFFKGADQGDSGFEEYLYAGGRRWKRAAGRPVHDVPTDRPEPGDPERRSF